MSERGNGGYPIHKWVNGRLIGIQELTFGRGRLCIGDKGPCAETSVERAY